jgi:peptidoglycan-N-acetylglucosamine deacetylase
MASTFQWPNGKRAAISLSFDDARLSQPDKGFALLHSFGVKATFYVSFGSLEKRLDQWKSAIEMGHEIGNHSVTHPCSGNFPWARPNALEDYTLERIEKEMTDANDRIKSLLGVSPTTFAYPCGQKFVGRAEQTKSYVPLVAKHFKAGRGFRDEMPNDPAFCDPAQLFGVDADNTPFDELMEVVNQTISRNGWLVLAGHEIGTEGPQTVRLDTLSRLCQYCL